jgi:hypothetical protein
MPRGVHARTNACDLRLRVPRRVDTHTRAFASFGVCRTAGLADTSMQPQCSAVAAAATVTADGGEEPQSDQRTARERRTARLICSVRVSSGATGSFSAACEQRQALTTDCVRRSAAHTNEQTNMQTTGSNANKQTNTHTQPRRVQPTITRRHAPCGGARHLPLFLLHLLRKSLRRRRATPQLPRRGRSCRWRQRCACACR